MSSRDPTSDSPRKQSSRIDQRLNQVACDLHDGLLQYVIAARMLNEALRRKLASSASPLPSEVDSVEQYLQQAIGEGRALISRLQTAQLPELDLVAALRQLLERFAAEGQVQCEVDFSEDVPLDAAAREALFRVAQEAISNVRRHSQATTIQASLRRDNNSVLFELVDNGQGFDPAVARPGHLGLAGMRQRVESLGGDLLIESTLEKGTRVVARLPHRP